jgi:hypothetical protein
MLEGERAGVYSVCLRFLHVDILTLRAVEYSNIGARWDIVDWWGERGGAQVSPWYAYMTRGLLRPVEVEDGLERQSL